MFYTLKDKKIFPPDPIYGIIENIDEDDAIVVAYYPNLNKMMSCPIGDTSSFTMNLIYLGENIKANKIKAIFYSGSEEQEMILDLIKSKPFETIEFE